MITINPHGVISDNGVEIGRVVTEDQGCNISIASGDPRLAPVHNRYVDTRIADIKAALAKLEEAMAKCHLADYPESCPMCASIREAIAIIRRIQ